LEIGKYLAEKPVVKIQKIPSKFTFLVAKAMCFSIEHKQTKLEGNIYKILIYRFGLFLTTLYMYLKKNNLLHVLMNLTG